MPVIVGFLLVLFCVFGGYTLSGGKMEIVLHALPFEGLMILGGSIGSYIIANKGIVVKATLKAFSKALKGPKWKKQDYQDILCLMFLFCKLMKSKGMIAVESHIEKPEESSIFKQFPNVMKDHFTIEIICDTLRMLTMGMDNAHSIEDLLERKIEKHHHEIAGPAHAMQTMADGMPAIGIVAAVLGVIKTMASVTEPPEILGKMIGGALVGTFLGVFLSYCLVGPIASKVSQSLDEEQQFYFIIRDILVAHLKGMAPQISIEIGRGNVPQHYQPSFAEMEEITNNLKVEGTAA